METGFNVDVRPLPLAEFMQADEVFKSTSGGGVLAITRVDDRIFAKGTTGPITQAPRQDIGNGCTGLPYAPKSPISSFALASWMVRRRQDNR